MPINLVQHRDGPNVWDSASACWDVERWVASMAAGGLLFAAARQRSAGGLLMAAAAGTLAWWAMCAPGSRRYRRGQLRAAWPASRASADPVGEASEESFPASDAPALTPTTL